MIIFVWFPHPRTRDSATNRLHFLAPVFGAGFSYHMCMEWKFLAPKINVAESDVDDEFVKESLQHYLQIETKRKWI